MIELYFSPDFKGEGISEGLERGILVDINKQCIVQEGMGLGAPALKTKTRTFFSNRSKTTKIADNIFLKEFYMDSEFIWEIIKSKRFRDSNLLTVFINKLTDFYKRRSYIQQNLLKLGIFSRNFFQVKSKIKRTGVLGVIVFKYEIRDSSVLIDVDFSHLVEKNAKNVSKICILNELGGEVFNLSKINGNIYPPPSGWVKFNDKKGNKLHSKKLNIDFSFEVIEKPTDYEFNTFIGREKISNFCWAGYAIEIEAKAVKNQRNDCKIRYICEVSEL